ncbi:hypothetical protein EYZ11_002838 [Aspergillus tanneri]|uniref:Major facilitator superfamily (MFS) profile domain-containing protein n=1 Tax=Aspergillus tanneri TaxID=1220188 RepID=A0A4S3JPY9_9EURO|nr:hypothetical protein EYZ11_002838 [Aspergillus tanneri]
MTDTEKQDIRHMGSCERLPSIPEDVQEITVEYPRGWRLFLTTVGVLASVYLVNLEVTIVSTSLISITNDLNGFEKTSWIATAFLTTYTGRPFVGDITGRKKAIIAADIVFLMFSMGCGASKTVDQL